MANNNKRSHMPDRPQTTLGDLFNEVEGLKDKVKPSEPAGGNHVNIERLQDGDIVDDVYYCSSKSTAISKAGKPFLNMVVQDRTGEMVVRVFEDAEQIGSLFTEGDFIHLHGRSQSYQGNLQIVARDVQRVDPATLNHEDFIPCSRFDPEVMMARLRKMVDGIADADLKALCFEMLNDPEIGKRFYKSPAAKGMHHSYLHGLMEHTLSMCLLAEKICTHFHKLNHDLILAGCLFHDIGKIYELGYDVAIDYTDSGKLLGHITIGVMILEKLAERLPGFPVEKKRLLEHVIVAHHGTRDFGSPIIPATVEALVIHHIDNIDAKVNASLNFIEKSSDDSEWTDRHFLLETRLRKTSKADTPLYDFTLDEDKKDK